MRRGTTPTYEFEIVIDGQPIDLALIDEIEVAFSQYGATILKKTKSMCNFSGNVVSFTLTQEETFMFKETATIEVQVRVLTKLKTVPSSDIFKLDCERCLSREVLK